MSAKVKSAFTFILKIAVAAALIVFLVRSGHLDFHVVWDLMTVPNVILALVLIGLNTAIAAWRWIFLLKARGINIPVGYGFGLYLIGMFFNYALPGAVSGDLVRGYYLVQDYPSRKMDAALSVLIDRILGLYSFFILTMVAIAADLDFVMTHEKIRWVALLTVFLFLGMTGFFILSFSTRMYRWSHFDFVIRRIGFFKRLMEGFQSFGSNRSMLGLSVLVSLAGQIFTMIFFYEMGGLLHEPEVTWKAVLFAVPMGFVVTAIPIAPAGVGVGQVAFLYLFQTYMNKASTFGAVSITAFQLTTAVWSMAGAWFYIRRRKPHELDNLEVKMEAANP